MKKLSARKVKNILNRSLSLLMAAVMSFGTMASNINTIYANSVEEGMLDEAPAGGDEGGTPEHVHIFSYATNNNGNHTVTCTVDGCSYNETEECAYDTGICTKCSYDDPDYSGKPQKPEGEGKEDELDDLDENIDEDGIMPRLNSPALYGAPAYQVYIKPSDGTMSNIYKDNNAQVEYGDKFTFVFDGIDNVPRVNIKKSGSDEDLPFDTETVYEPGRYYVGWESDEDDSIHNADFTDYYFDVVPTRLAYPEDLKWDEENKTKLSFNTVKTDYKNNSITAESAVTISYAIKIYKNGVLVKTEDSVAEVAGDVQYYDVASLINSEEGGEGRYTFKVTALSSDSSYYTNSRESDLGDSPDAYLNVVRINIEKGVGISFAYTDDPVNETEQEGRLESFLMVSGESQKLKASGDSDAGWSFKKWEWDNPAISFDDENYGAPGKFTYELGDEMEYVSTIVIKAVATEKNAPTIVSYGVGEGDDEGKIVAQAYDSQTGVKAYAFATSMPSDDSSEWTELASPVISDEYTLPEDSPVYKYVPKNSGKYYFYIKDAVGNTGVSSDAINVSKIKLDSYYVNNSKKSETDSTIIQLGSDEIILPTEDITRKGYEFKGWYKDEEHTEKITKISENAGSDVIVYAYWNLVTPTWENELVDTTKTYQGKNIPLTVSVNTNADVTYKWFYREKAGDDFTQLSETSATLNVRDVKDSGEYKVTAVIKYTDDDGTPKEYLLEGTPATITIKPRDLNVKADNKRIGYLSEIPTYTYTYYGLVGEDSDKGNLTAKGKDSITEGTLKSDYKKGDAVGSFTISFDNHFTSSGNYNITEYNGLLTVAELDVTEISAVINLTETAYQYTGSAIEPLFTVTYKDTDGNDVQILSDDYDISYDEDGNIKAGTHTLKLTFKRYYKGELSADFSITKGTHTGDTIVEIADWEYGDTAAASAAGPNIKTDTMPSDITDCNTTFYYVRGELSSVNSTTGGSTAKPVNAGKYTVYALIHDNDGNYEDFYTVPTVFTISPRKIYIKAKSKEWEYDGNSHSYPVSDADKGYTFELKDGTKITEEDVFILRSESFASIQLNGSVKNVVLDDEGNNIGVENNVVYSMKANADNYDIICVPGTLKVTAAKLNVPANPKWDDSKPGQATWVAISKKDLIVEYRLQLFVSDPDKGTDEIVKNGDEDYFVTSDTYYDFSEIIHNQISTNSKKSFYFTIQTIVKDSSDEGKNVKNDYSDSEVSTPSDKICTATITLTKKVSKDGEENPGIASIVFTGEYAGQSTITLIAGESFNIKVDATLGYGLNNLVTHESGDIDGLSISYSRWVYGTKRYYFTSEIKVKPDIAESLPDIQLTCETRDDGPTSRSLTYSNSEDLTDGVKVSAELYDGLSLKRWRLEKVTESTQVVGDKTQVIYRHDSYVGDWHNVKEDGSTIADTWVLIDTLVKTPGTFRIEIEDATDNTATTDVFTVYEIKFDKGVSDDTVHTMLPIYKLANTEITLPLNKFEKTGYAFQNWTGDNSGTSVDGAVYKANVSDTLVAHWTNRQYKYTVNYFYMNTEGKYPSEPESTEEFWGKYGEKIVAANNGEDVATSSIQKPRKNYANDPAPGIEGYENSISLTENGKVLNVYYSSGSYKITYSYKIPGSETTYEYVDVRYGAAIQELTKPSVEGYDFVGWVYEGYGTAPEKMPAENLSASGTFVAKQANYKVVYHMETLGQGEAKTEKYSIDSKRTLTLNSKQGESIRAYLMKGDDLDQNEVEGGKIDGFTLKGMVITEGAPSNSGAADDTLPADITEAGTISGTVEYNTSKTLYINYYYTRNVYDFVLEVWKDNRENDANRKYSSIVKRQYEEDVQDLTSKYMLDSYYVDENNVSKLEGFAMPEGYKFATYTDYSTGNAPLKMPAGKVTAIRDIFESNKVHYTIKLYFEKTALDEYTELASLDYEAVPGAKIKIVENQTPDDDEYKYINYSGDTGIAKIINNSSFYKWKKTVYGDPDANVAEYATVNEDGSTVIEIYFERKTTTAAIRYYYGNTKQKGDNQFAVFYVSGKWGSTYEIDPAALFDPAAEDWYSSNTSYQKNTRYPLGVDSAPAVNSITDKDGVTQDGRTYDFRNNNYLVSYQGFYYYFDTNDTRTWTYPSYTLTDVDTSGTTDPVVCGKETKLNNRVTCIFGCSSTEYEEAARCYIYYNEISEKEDFYLDVRFNQNSFKDKDLTGWNYSTSEGYNHYDGTTYGSATGTYTYIYPDGKSYIPVVYGYDEDGSGTIDANEYFQVRIINKCAVVKGTKVAAGEGLDNYPASNSKSRSYTYSDDDISYAGFKRIGKTNYYFYNGNGKDNDGVTGNDGETAYSNKKAVYYVDSSDRFLQGAYVGYSLGTDRYERQQAEAIVASYMSAHASSNPELYAKDDNASALYCTNASYGSTHVTGNYSYINLNYEYHDKVYLYYYYNGITCSAHQYSYGRTVSVDEIGCSHVFTAPEGYKLVWYTDSARTKKVNADIKLTSNKTLYGNLEKSSIKNIEYVHYELADPVVVGEKTYNYIDAENLDAISSKLGSKLVYADVDENTRIYYVEGTKALVIKYRPTLSFTELYLSKDDEGNADKTYEGVYGLTGFYYDETNTSNRSYGYVNTVPIKLHVYFARDKYQVEVRPLNSETANSEFKTFSIDQHVIIGDYSKDGYSFEGWKWYKASDNSVYVPTIATGESYIRMPDYDLIAEAIWEPAEFDQQVTHYFQTASMVYNSTFITGLEGKAVDSNLNEVKFGENTYDDATIYTSGSNVEGVKFVKNGVTYYFSKGTVVDENTLEVKEADLIAAQSVIEVKSEKNTDPSMGSITDLSMYQYSYTSCHAGTEVNKYTAEDSYIPKYGMTLEYYYPRSADLRVRLLAMSADGEESGLILTGAGSHMFGENVNLTANKSDGYTFKGWYSPNDIFRDADGSEVYESAFDTELSAYPVRTDLRDAIENNWITPVCLELVYPVTMVASLDLIAVSMPEDTVAPTLSITGKQEYVYGYAASASNAFMAIAGKKTYTADEDPYGSKTALAAKTTITGYQWYRIPATFADDGITVIPNGEPERMVGQTSSTLLFEQGMHAGAYIYRCEVSYKNSANGREGVITADRNLIVKKAKMTVEITPVEKTFDNNYYSIGLVVREPYGSTNATVYYHADTPLTKDNYDPENGGIGILTLPSYKDVNHDAFGACANVTYIYIKDNTGNYEDYVGSGLVNIKPKTISIKAKNQIFSKIYDASVDVTGDIKDPTTDLGKLAAGNGSIYELVGFVDGDSAVESYILSCDAAFNSEHVSKANSFTVSNMKLAFKTDGKTAYNYAFKTTDTLTFSGHIEARTLDIEWEDKDKFIYNGEPQAPSVAWADSENNRNIPERDKGKIDLTVTGKQTNVTEDGKTYTAYAQATHHAEAQFESSDYTFNDLSKNYTIVKRKITIKPDDAVVTYDGTNHTITSYKILNTNDGTVDAVASKATYIKSVSEPDAKVNAYIYDDMEYKHDFKITSATGVDLTYNYDITYEIGTLTINKEKVKVTGIKAENKNYDGTTDAVIHINDPETGASYLTFTPLHSQNGVVDKLDLDISKISAQFADKAAGTGTVNLIIPADALIGDSAANYELIPSTEESGSQKEATALIRKSVIKVKAVSESVVYGEDCTFECTYADIIKDDGTVGTIDDISGAGLGEVSYLINTGTDESPNWVSYTKGDITVGEYEIQVDVSGLTHSDFTFEWDEDKDIVLAVTKRPVRIVAKTDDFAKIVKEYDGNTTSAVPIKGTNYEFLKTKDATDTEIEASGVLDKDAGGFDLSEKVYEYDTENVTAQYVKLTNAKISDGNYQLVNDSVDIPGEITHKSLTISAKAKEITYGDKTPQYEAEYTGFIDGEDENSLTGNLTFTNSRYNPSVEANRHVGTYTSDINPTGFGVEGSNNGNYTIHYVPANLTVVAAVVYYTADNQTMRYKVGNSDGDHTGEIPSYTYSGPEWKYPEDEDRYKAVLILPQTESGLEGGNPITLLTVPGSYPIQIKIDADENVLGVSKSSSEDTYEDYIFKATGGTLTVKRFKVKVTGSINIKDRYYDGTDKIKADQLPDNYSTLSYEGIDDADQSEAGIDTTKLISDSKYASKNAGESVTISLKIELNEYLAARYEIDEDNTNVTASSKILPRPIEIKAKNKTIKYGSLVPDDYGIETVPVSEHMTETNMGLVGDDTISLFSSPTGYECEYKVSPYSEVGTYAVEPVGVTSLDGNYAINLIAGGILTVTQNKLAAPVPVWDSDRPGTVKWDAVSSIGDVSVAGYVAELYVEGDATPVDSAGSKESPLTATEYNFAAKIHEKGGGKYYVKVTAIAATENNADNKNVADSNKGETVKRLYATKVTPLFAGDSDGIGTKDGGKNPVYIKDKSASEAYVIIAGETPVDLIAKLKNATGYKASLSADAGITLGTVGDIDVVSDGDAGKVTSSISVAATAEPAAETNVTVTLAARDATLKANISTADNTTLTYGYTAVPKFVATPETVSDNIDTDGYKYTYEWYIRMNGASTYTLMASGTDNTYDFPTGYNVGANYRVQCKVTAERKDNGKKESVIALTTANAQFVQVRINRGTYDPYLTYSGNNETTWVYGESRIMPVIEGLMPEVTSDATKTLKYSTNIAGPFDTDKMYTDVGTYYVIAELSETENYEAKSTAPVKYTITQNKLSKPTNVNMVASSTAPYGKVTWDAVTGYFENNSMTIGEYDSRIYVKYELKLSYVPKGQSSKVDIGSPVETTDRYYDFTNMIKEPGTYYVSVQAKVDEKRAGKDCQNCLDSDLETVEAVITIGAEVSSNGEADATGFRKVYDGTPLTLKVNYSAGSDSSITYTYQWKKNGVNYTGPGANTDEISITYVDENAVFVCEVIPSTDSKPVYTKAETATIVPRKITVNTGSDEKVYDGTPLTNSTYDIKLTGSDAAGLATGDSVDTINVKGTITDVNNNAASNNIYDSLVIKRGDKKVYESGYAYNNYEVTDSLGTLSIKPVEITLKPKNIDAEYKGSAYVPVDYEITGSLVTGDTLDNITYSGSRRDVGETTSSIKAGVKVLKSGDATQDNTSNYSITLNPGSIKVNAKTILINTESDSKDYTGTALTKHSASLDATTSLASGDSIDFDNDIVWSGTQTNAGNSDNSIASIIVRQGSEDVTPNYNVTYNFGTLTVNKIARVITASDALVYFDGNNHTITATAEGILPSDSATANLEYKVGGNAFTGASERGEYLITITAPATENYDTVSKTVKLVIKRKIKITANSDSKDYDGLPLTNGNYTVAFQNAALSGEALAAGDSISDIVITGSQTVKGSSDNVPSGTVIKDASDNDVSSFYDIEYVNGTLTVGQKTLTITAKSAEWDYNATEHKLNEYEQEGLADGETLTVTFKDGSKITDYGTVTNEIDTVKVFKGGEEVTGNYSIITKSGELKVKKINLKFKPVNVTAVYDGNAHVPVAFEITEGSLKGSDAIDEVVYAGTRTNVGNTASTISSYKIKNGAKDVTNNYNVITDIGNIEITPYILTEGDLTISPESFEYTGADVGPSMIKVAVDLINDDKHDRSTVITEGSDYSVTSDGNKRRTASQVGTYTVEITGTGNYSGTLSKTYTISDNSSAEIKDGNENDLANLSTNKYCKEAKIVVTDPNLYSVVITNSAGEEVAKQENITAGTYTYTLEGQGEDIDTPAEYTVTVKDVKGKAMDGTLSYNEQTVYIKLYPDHHFDNYTVCDKAPIGEVYEGTCIHDLCDAKDYIIKPSGTVRWDYNYSYSTTTGTQEGTKAHDQRATYARVDLYMNNQIVASKIVDCDSQCGISGAYDEGSCTYTFEGYNPYDVASDTGLSYLPYYNNEGSVNNFHIRVVPLTKLGDGSYENVIDYTVTYSMDNLPEDNALIEYKPGCFEVPWVVTLKDVPEGMVPEEIYVKILYASSEDDEDEDYRIITQQISPDNKGFLCDAIDNGDGTYSYSGEYPCWKYISGTTKTYYHRIQITGYVVDGHYVDTSSKRFMSACDKDHINHTVTYDPATDASTGTIQYTLNGLVPTLIFDVNYGSEDRNVYAILAAGIDAFGNGGEITNDDFNSVHNPSRPGYTFQGWFTSPTGGTRVTGNVSLEEGTVRLYAHWMIIKPAETPNEIPSEEDGGQNNNGGSDESPNATISPKPSTSPTPIVVPNPVESPTNKPTDNGRKPTNNADVTNEGNVNGEESPAPVPSNKPNDSEGEDSKSGSLKVYVENTGDDTSDVNTNTDSPDAGEDKAKDRITGDLPDTEAVAEAVLTDEERKILEEGGNIVIRLTVDDSRKDKPSEEEDPALYIVLNQLEKDSQEDIPGGKPVFISFVDLKLEKSINAADWERILESGMEIPVVINLPDGSVLGARRLVLARREGDHFVILEDLDDDPNTITFMTNDFESDYVLLGIEEIEELTEDNDCFWHWLILLTGIIELMILLITKSRKKIEENDDPEITPEEIEKKRKRVRNIRIADYVLGTNISLIFAIFGTCWLDWPIFAVQVVVCTSAEYLKEKKKKEEEQAG